MSSLDQVTTGVIQSPMRILIYGVDKVGKSTFASEAPSPVFLGPESGTERLNVSRLPAPSSYEDVLAQIDDLINGKHDYKTLAIDSLDWIEPLVFEKVCFDYKWKNIEDPGWKKGHEISVEYWRKIIQRLNTLREKRRMNIIAIAHTIVRKAKDPQNQAEYERFEVKIYDKSAALWREFVDFILFANFETMTHKEKGGKVRAFGGEIPYVYTKRTAGYDAGNRYGLPEKMDLDWEIFWNAVQQGEPDKPENIVAQIRELLSEVTDQQVKLKVEETLKKVGMDGKQLLRIENKLRTLVGV